jgi:exo-beta-1,3-glucanase (GH17 family)
MLLKLSMWTAIPVLAEFEVLTTLVVKCSIFCYATTLCNPLSNVAYRPVAKNHMLINSIWNTEKLPDQWMESIIMPVHKKGDRTDCSNYQGISVLLTSYKILSNILSRLSQYIDEIIGNHQCGV